MNAADLMTRKVITVAPETPLVDAARLMLDNQVSGLPVVNQSGRLVGVITEGDLLHRVEIGTGTRSLGWISKVFALGAQADAYVQAHGRKVADVMTRQPVAVDAATSVSEVVALMERHRIKRVPVLADGRVVGVVSRADILRAVAAVLAQRPAPLASDTAIRERVAAELANHPWGAHAWLTAEVENGTVRLQGTVADERSRAAVRVAVENVPGVKSVVDELVWVEPISGMYFGTP